MKRTVGGAVCLGVSLLLGACGSSPLAPEVFARTQPTDPARIRVVIPEVYELANVIVALTSFGQSSPVAVRRTGEYYQRVNAAFSAFRDHSSMGELQIGSSDPLRQYYYFRDNSSAYLFEDGVGLCGPDERFRLIIMSVDVVIDGLLQLFDAVE